MSRPASTLLLLAIFPIAHAQSSRATPKPERPIHKSTPPTPVVPKSDDPQAELQIRLTALQAAFQTGNPENIKSADRKVLAFALKQIAELRMVENAFPQAIELYGQSIQFEDVPQSHLRLALAYLQVKKPDETLEETEKALYSDPENPVAWRLKGSAWMQRKDYQRAAEALAHSIKLKGDSETAYNLGVCLLAAHQKQKAQLVFDDIQKHSGNTGQVHLMFGKAYREQNYLDDAEREFRRAIALDPTTPHAHYFLGLLLLMKNEWMPTPEVRDLFHAELTQHPRDYLANYLLGMFASSEKRYDESDRYLTIAAEGFPDWPEPPLYMGLNSYGRQDFKAAEALIQKAIQITGNDESRGDYDIRRGYIALGRMSLSSGKKEEADRYFAKSRQLLETALKASQQNVSNIASAQGATAGMGAVVPRIENQQEQQAIGDIYFGDPSGRVDLSTVKLSPEEKQQAQQEEQYLRQVLGSSFNDLGTAGARQQEYASALRDFNQAARWNPDIPGLTRNLGIAAFKLGEYKAAVAALSQQVAANPQDASARAMLGISYFWLNSYQDAVKTFAPLGNAAWSDIGLAYPWAASLVRTGDLKTATAVLTAVEQQQLPPDTLLLIGQTWSQAGDYSRALQSFHRALQLNPELPKAHYNAGLACIYAGHPADAENELKAELAMFPQDNNTKYNLAYAYLLQSQPEKALPLLQEIVASDPSYADAQYQLGKLKLEDGKADEAVKHLEQAERTSPEKDYVHYQLQAAYRKLARTEDAERELALYKETKARNREKTLPHPSQTQ